MRLGFVLDTLGQPNSLLAVQKNCWLDPLTMPELLQLVTQKRIFLCQNCYGNYIFKKEKKREDNFLLDYLSRWTWRFYLERKDPRRCGIDRRTSFCIMVCLSVCLGNNIALAPTIKFLAPSKFLRLFYFQGWIYLGMVTKRRGAYF